MSLSRIVNDVASGSIFREIHVIDRVLLGCQVPAQMWYRLVFVVSSISTDLDILDCSRMGTNWGVRTASVLLSQLQLRLHRN
jgi:hypothetical protein